MSAYSAQTGRGSWKGKGVAKETITPPAKPQQPLVVRALVLAGLLLALHGGRSASAQTPNLPTKKYMCDNVILLPVHIDPRFLNELQEVKLYVKDNPANPWDFAGSVAATQKEFVYKAPKDGEYWFTLVTVNKAGQPSADVTTQSAQAIVVLDREKPRVDIHNVGLVPTGQCIQCRVTDEHADVTATVFEYQTKDKQWRALDTISGSMDTYCIPSQAATTGQVRVTAMDRCGNKTQKIFNLQDCPPVTAEGAGNTAGITKAPPHVTTPQVTPPQVTPPAPPAAPAPPVQVPEPHSTVSVISPPPLPNPLPSMKLPEDPLPTSLVPVQASSQSFGNPTTSQSFNSPAATEKGIEPVSHTLPPSAIAREIVSKTKFMLNYQIDAVGQSGVGKVEVWSTKDAGQHWQRLAEDSDRKSPVELTLPGEGLFGLILVAKNGLGFGGDPPAPGSQPEWWVEVDMTPPQTQLIAVESPMNTGGSGVLITWLASDKNLMEEPIDLFYSSEPNGPWQAIAKGLKNTGQFRWQVPTLTTGRVYVRVSVTDRAGNTAVSQTAQAVQLDDLSRPKVHIQGISSNAAQVELPSLLPALSQ